MKKHFFMSAMLCALTTITACQNGTATDTTLDQTDTNEITWETISDKLPTPLTEDECLFILSDTTLDDGSSEGVGNSLFQLLKGNRQANEMFVDACKDFTPDEGDSNLRRLMMLMSIDIAYTGYGKYEHFLQDFPMFRSCTGAEEQFNYIQENGI